jgi:hypothetical protein
MPRKKKFKGDNVQTSAPDFGPLLNVIHDDTASWFMWMHEVELEDETRIHCFKHRWNRRSIHLSEEGKAYLYTWDPKHPERDGKYERVKLVEALTAVLGIPFYVEHEMNMREVEHLEPKGALMEGADDPELF